ncbi:hypothetical protein KIN20_003437 [Parelaphostrongylus tenuis]|uniref:Uncharacterized protein n=1 Tax=Parelaphostrongylus tenuis TaxID=148309 RepID=A0AAD5QG22_PARTN|nr:hypothetical protein KIN20_003437 [Parelaphostrongylus tenuis]
MPVPVFLVLQLPAQGFVKRLVMQTPEAVVVPSGLANNEWLLKNGDVRCIGWHFTMRAHSMHFIRK